MARTVRCDEHVRIGRLAKAIQFFEAADTIAAFADAKEAGDALVTLLVHAGVAASDVLCCARLGGARGRKQSSGRRRAPSNHRPPWPEISPPCWR